MVETATLKRPASSTAESLEIPAAILFPGQGLPPKEICSYYQLLTELNPALTTRYLSLAQQALEKISGSPSFNIETALKDASSPDFRKTSFVQPVVYSLSVLAYEIMRPRLRERNIIPDVMAGHSLGEYSAMTAAGVFPFEEGIEIVTYRGKVMQEACDENESSLTSISGLNLETVRDEICFQTGAEIALVNAPDLIVVGSRPDQIPKIKAVADQIAGQSVRVVTLETAGAFHTPFMIPAAVNLARFLANYEFTDPQYRFVNNYTGGLVESGVTLRDHSSESMTRPVWWAKSLQTMKELGSKTFLESGPGVSLKQINKRNGIGEDQTKNIVDISP
ncbi:ACP S-malonyltransferase [Candidatus Microgenomates bacterium]|nr:ACP S-malonyltransferase [Candidatus Microgenomates bacterium]